MSSARRQGPLTRLTAERLATGMTLVLVGLGPIRTEPKPVAQQSSKKSEES